MCPGPDHRLGPEFSRLLQVEALGEDEVVEEIEASETERQALAERLDLLSLERLSAVLRVERQEGGTLVGLGGHFEADVTQACVVSLVPVRRHLADDFTALYTLLPAAGGDSAQVDLDAEAKDPPETIGPEGLDLGEAVVQQLAIVLDPYPRADDASLEALEWIQPDEQMPADTSPFSQLKTLGENES